MIESKPLRVRRRESSSALRVGLAQPAALDLGVGPIGVERLPIVDRHGRDGAVFADDNGLVRDIIGGGEGHSFGKVRPNGHRGYGQIDLAGLDRGEFDFAKPPPVGGPEGQEAQGGSVQVPELTAVLDTLEEQINDRAQQLGALEMVMASRELGQRIMPGGLPLIGGWISSHFGHRSDPFTGRGAFHAGVDFAGPTGSRVIAVGPGVVSYSGWKQGYGNVVEITHPTGYVTRYGHNSRNLVQVGQSVQKNDAIAVIGSTGRSTGTHVHFEVLRDGNVLNPMKYLVAP